MKIIAAIATAALVLLATPAGASNDPAEATAAGPSAVTAPPTVYARVSIAAQRMEVVVLGDEGAVAAYSFKTSTGKRGYGTPTGAYQPTWLSRYHRSRKYDNAPMPYAVFFNRGYAVHATDAVKHLGRPASHGCVRLSPKDASTFYRLVTVYGRANTRIVIGK